MGQKILDLQRFSVPIGWIPYWNLQPMKIELLKLLGSDFNLAEGHPTEINLQLSESKLLCAPSSAANLILSRSAEIALPLGVCADGPVQSVYIGVNQNASEFMEFIRFRSLLIKDIVSEFLNVGSKDIRLCARQIVAEVDALPVESMASTFAPYLKLSVASASGSMLAKLMLRLLFGQKAFTNLLNQTYSFDCPQVNLELVIGDEALIRRPQFTRILDLGQLWKLITGLPFVYAIWQKSVKHLQPGITKALMQAASLAEARMHLEPSSYLPATIPLDCAGREIDLANYWRKISYRVDIRATQALLLFLCLGREMLHFREDENIALKLLRWSQVEFENMRHDFL